MRVQNLTIRARKRHPRLGDGRPEQSWNSWNCPQESGSGPNVDGRFRGPVKHCQTG